MKECEGYVPQRVEGEEGLVAVQKGEQQDDQVQHWTQGVQAGRHHLPTYKIFIFPAKLSRL